MFSLGILELILTASLAMAALAVSFRRMAVGRWLVPLAGCFALASILTPADPATTILFTSAFLGCFYLGTRRQSANASQSA